MKRQRQSVTVHVIDLRVMRFLIFDRKKKKNKAVRDISTAHSMDWTVV